MDCLEVNTGRKTIPASRHQEDTLHLEEEDTNRTGYAWRWTLVGQITPGNGHQRDRLHLEVDTNGTDYTWK